MRLVSKKNQESRQKVMRKAFFGGLFTTICSLIIKHSIQIKNTILTN